MERVEKTFGVQQKNVFKLKSVLCSKVLNIQLRVRMLQCFLLYSAKLTLMKAIEKKLEA